MESIVFEEELVREKVYEGTFIIDERLTPRQQRRKIFNMMRKDNIPVMDESEYEIGYEGVEDNDGLSETQETRFIVTHVYNKKIPYRVSKEEVYEGTYILDGSRITPEEQRQRIFDMMREDGYNVENEDEYEIGYEGVEDDNGISETQTTHFVVSRVKKERLTDEEYEAVKQDDNEEVRKLYDEMVSLKNDVLQTKDSEKVQELSEKIDRVTGEVDSVVEKSIKNYGTFEDQIDSLNKEIKELEIQLQENISRYEASYEKMKALMEENDITSNELSIRKEQENENAIEIKKEIDRIKRQLSSLKGKRTKTQKDYDTAKALEISAEEYNEIVSNLRKSSILEAILETKGLGEVVAIPARERTPQQKKQIMDARKEIMEEIAKLQRENERQSVLSSIEALYGIELQKVKQNGKPKILIVKKSALENIQENVKNLPEKVVKTQETAVNYTPGEVPEDLKDVFENRKAQQEEILRGIYIPGEENIRDVILRDHGIDIDKDKSYEVGYEGVSDDDGISETLTTEYIVYKKKEESRGIIDKYTIFHDEQDESKLYARKPVFERFHIEPIGEEVRVENTASYGISKEDAEYIENNANNNYSPYIVEHKTAKIVSKEEKKPSTNSLGITEKVTIFRDINDKDAFYVRKPILERFHINPVSDSLRIENVVSYQISKEDADYIIKNADNNYSPYIISNVDIQINEEDKETKNVDDVLNKIKVAETEPTADKYNFTNVKVSENFKQELKDGNVSYNIINKMTKEVKASVSFFTKLGEKLVHSKVGEQAQQEMKDNLNDISNKDLEKLMDHYKTTELKDKMNENMTPIVKDRLVEYGISTLDKIDYIIGIAYTQLSSVLGDLKAVEVKSLSEEISDDDMMKNEESRNELIQKASKIIQVIISSEEEAEKLLMCGVDDLEKKFEEVSQYMKYISNQNDSSKLDEDLQTRYKNFRKNLDSAMTNHNDVAIVQNFLGAESCFSDDETIQGQIVGRRKLGISYYKMIANKAQAPVEDKEKEQEMSSMMNEYNSEPIEIELPEKEFVR